MSAGWVNLKDKQRQLREYEKVMRERGYSHGYSHLPARSVDATYQAAWRRGYQARNDFDDGNRV